MDFPQLPLRRWLLVPFSRGRMPDLFIPFFALYTLTGAGLLVLGLLPYLISVSPSAHAQFHIWSAGQGLPASVAGVLVEPLHEHIVSGTGAVVRDYFFSLLNLVLGIFVVWRRPKDWVARLLGMGMVGSGVVYNFYAHEAVFALYPVLSSLSAVHVVYHGLAPAGYLHAIVLFPDGAVVPQWLKRVIPFVYLAMVVFIGLNVYTYIFAPTSLPGFDTGFNAESLTFFAQVNVALDILLVGVFFGLATPLAGAISQLYRSRTPRTLLERQQARLVVWALSSAFGASLIVLLAAGTYIAFSEGGFSGAALRRLEHITLQVFPPLFSIVPIALFISILRYRLFDIDLLINRTVVYAPLTAVLGGLIPPAVLIFKWLLSVITGGEQSEMALILAALSVSAVVSHLRVKLQTLADVHFRPRLDPKKRLEEFSAQVRSVVQVTDIGQIARRLLDEAALALGADQGAVVLQVGGELLTVAAKGNWDGNAALRIPLESDGLRFGMVFLGPRSNGTNYESLDMSALQQAADVVAQAMAMMGEEQWQRVQGRRPLVPTQRTPTELPTSASPDPS